MSISKRSRPAIRIATTLLSLIGFPAVVQASVVSYDCADGTTLLAHYQLGRSELETGGGTMSLPQAVSADGGRYLSGDLDVWVEGREEDLTRGAVQTPCSASR